MSVFETIFVDIGARAQLAPSTSWLGAHLLEVRYRVVRAMRSAPRTAKVTIEVVGRGLGSGPFTQSHNEGGGEMEGDAGIGAICRRKPSSRRCPRDLSAHASASA